MQIFEFIKNYKWLIILILIILFSLVWYNSNRQPKYTKQAEPFINPSSRIKHINTSFN